MKYHVKNDIYGWTFEEVEEPNLRHNVRLLARIMIAKIEDETRLVSIIRQVPLIQADPNWRCRTWMMNVITAIAADRDSVGKAVLDWEKIEAFAKDYIGRKTQFDRYSSAETLAKARPTWDLLSDQELIP